MGLAPGVVIRPVKTTIPKMGLPFELLAAKMQNIQQTKDAFDALAELKPKALAMEGDQALLGKYNQYVEKIAGSVADAFASGDATKAQRMLSAAKTQLTREWKEGGVAFALKDRAEAMAKGMNEIAEREIGDDYKQMNKEVDLYRFKKGIQEIDYDLETGKYNRIGAAGMTTHVDLMAKADTYAKALGEDKRGYIDFIKAASGSRTNIMGLIHEEKVKDKKIQQQLQAYLSDPEVDAQLRLEQDWKNIRANRLDDPSKMISDASEYVNSEIDNLKNAVSDLEKMSITQQKYVLMQSGDYTGDFTATDNQALKDAKASYKEKINSSVKQRNEYIEKLNENDLETASGILFSYETADKYSKSFKNRFGITETVSNIQWPRAIDSGSSSSSNISKMVINPAVVGYTKTSSVDVFNKFKKNVEESEDAFRTATAAMHSYYTDNKDNFKGLTQILDLEDRPAAKTEEDREANILRFYENNKKVTQVANIVNGDDADDVKQQSIMSLFNVNAETADNIIKDFKGANTEITQLTNGFQLAYDDRAKAIMGQEAFYTNTTRGLLEAINNGDELENIKYSTNDNGSLNLNIKGSLGGPNAITTIAKEDIEKTFSRLATLMGTDTNKLTDEDKKFLYNTFGSGAIDYNGQRTPYVNEMMRTNPEKFAYGSFFNRLKESISADLLSVYSPVNTEWAIDKPGTRVNVGLSLNYNEINGYLKNFTQYSIDGDEENLDTTKIKDAEGNEYDTAEVIAGIDDEYYKIGVDQTGKPYLSFISKLEDAARSFKVAIPGNSPLYENLRKNIDAEVFADYAINGNYNKLQAGLNNLARFSKYSDDLSTAYVLNENINNAKNLEPANINFTEGDTTSTINEPGYKLAEIEGSVAMDGSEVKGDFGLHKVQVNNRWRYYVTFNDEVQYMLQPTAGEGGANTFEATEQYYTTDFNQAQNQLMLYINNNKFQGVQTEDELLSILE